MADIDLFGLTYLQKISDSVTGGALHIEPGIWVRTPDDPASPNQQNVTRMATIPHGNALLAEGTAIQVSPAGGTFNFDPVNTSPFKIGDPMPPGGTVSEFPEFDLAVPESAANPRTPFGNTPPIPLPGDINGVPMQTVINDPTRLLQAAIKGQNIKKMIVINIATVANPTGVKPVAGGGGGIENIPFLQTNANAAVMFATFWIETIEHPFHDFMQLQYVQTVILNFPIMKPPAPPCHSAGRTSLSQRSARLSAGSNRQRRFLSRQVRHNGPGNSRSGWNPHETQLTQASVQQKRVKSGHWRGTAFEEMRGNASSNFWLVERS